MPSGVWEINQFKDRVSLPEIIKRHGAGMVMVLGHLTGDPESRTVGADNILKAWGGIAVNFGKKPNETVEFYSWTAWRDTAEQILSLGKGDAVLFIGKCESRTWTGKDGEMRESSELTVYSLALPIYKRKEAGPGGPATNTNRQTPVEPDEDMPF